MEKFNNQVAKVRALVASMVRDARQEGFYPCYIRTYGVDCRGLFRKETKSSDKMDDFNIVLVSVKAHVLRKELAEMLQWDWVDWDHLAYVAEVLSEDEKDWGTTRCYNVLNPSELCCEGYDELMNVASDDIRVERRYIEYADFDYNSFAHVFAELMVNITLLTPMEAIDVLWESLLHSQED